MAENFAELREEFKAKKQSAFILGYTGESGKALLNELITSGIFEKIVLIGRREVTYEDERYKALEQRVIDFDKLEDHKEAFQGFDQGFSCLGTTRGKAGKDGFYRVDHDYVVNTARLAKDGGCSHLHLVSSQGANARAWLLYTKTKGEVEEELKQMSFDKLSIYRPAMLMCERAESRPMEKVARVLFAPMARFAPGVITTPTTILGQAMVNMAVSQAPREDPNLIIENKAIHRLAAMPKPESKK